MFASLLSKYTNTITITTLVAGVFFAAVVFFTSITPVEAIDFFPGADQNLLNTEAGDTLALGERPTTAVVIDLINTGLSLLALICLIMILYGGFLFIWARGNSETVQKAKDILEGTAIGLVIIISALGVIQFAFSQLADVTGTSIEQPAQQ